GLAGDHTIVLSTHILPEVAQTCQRVVIINKGRVVAVDTPDNLTSRLKGAATMYVQVDAPGADAGAALAAVRGVTRVTSADQPRGPVGPDLPPPQSTGPLAFEVESEPEVDVRRDLARAVVTRGWGLLELRPVRMSLEDVFLQVITEEVPAEAPRAKRPADSGKGDQLVFRLSHRVHPDRSLFAAVRVGLLRRPHGVLAA